MERVVPRHCVGNSPAADLGNAAPVKNILGRLRRSIRKTRIYLKGVILRRSNDSCSL